MFGAGLAVIKNGHVPVDTFNWVRYLFLMGLLEHWYTMFAFWCDKFSALHNMLECLKNFFRYWSTSELMQWGAYWYTTSLIPILCFGHTRMSLSEWSICERWWLSRKFIDSNGWTDEILLSHVALTYEASRANFSANTFFIFSTLWFFHTAN